LNSDQRDRAMVWNTCSFVRAVSLPQECVSCSDRLFSWAALLPDDSGARSIQGAYKIEPQRLTCSIPVRQFRPWKPQSGDWVPPTLPQVAKVLEGKALERAADGRFARCRDPTVLRL